MARYKFDWTDGTPKRVELTPEELAAREAEEKIWKDGSADRKLEMIKKIMMKNSRGPISYFKNRDIPQYQQLDDAHTMKLTY